jgi:LPS export ABC transporter protein LptC
MLEEPVLPNRLRIAPPVLTPAVVPAPGPRWGPARGRLLPALLGVLALAGCTFDYSGAQVERDEEEKIPQVELINVMMVVERDNRLELTASRIASYPAEKYQEFTDLRFREFGPEGDLRLEGAADSGVMALDTEDVELRGEVRFFSQVEDATIESEFLFWDADARIMTGTEDGVVRLEGEDGSWVEGRGLAVDGRRNSVTFSGGVEGVFQSEETP